MSLLLAGFEIMYQSLMNKHPGLVTTLSGYLRKWCANRKLAFRNPLHDPRVYEGAPPGIHVHTVHAYDPGRKSVMYNLLDVRDHTYFSMDSSSGNISTAKTIDKKIGDTYEVPAGNSRAVDNGALQRSRHKTHHVQVTSDGAPPCWIDRHNEFGNPQRRNRYVRGADGSSLD
ncbi:hypothetical protein AVEN_208967-1 [Araneus ventricosus]|uniref:Cadherin domain-containing protein n=1 Tax=Araneus ventricosus TaxID=182803 RepID=A0A4Y2CSL5_ARAVE|nr:hypothetical protein AVEN_208967-1 [Araneus ventricosus]